MKRLKAVERENDGLEDKQAEEKVEKKKKKKNSKNKRSRKRSKKSREINLDDDILVDITLSLYSHIFHNTNTELYTG